MALPLGCSPLPSLHSSLVDYLPLLLMTAASNVVHTNAASKAVDCALAELSASKLELSNHDEAAILAERKAAVRHYLATHWNGYSKVEQREIAMILQIQIDYIDFVKKVMKPKISYLLDIVPEGSLVVAFTTYLWAFRDTSDTRYKAAVRRIKELMARMTTEWRHCSGDRRFIVDRVYSRGQALSEAWAKGSTPKQLLYNIPTAKSLIPELTPAFQPHYRRDDRKDDGTQQYCFRQMTDAR
ncbi:hypothetical protein JCM11641_007126 [Rhodosporidiobolus odoratus]